LLSLPETNLQFLQIAPRTGPQPVRSSASCAILG
jgi:hypothetical protein